MDLTERIQPAISAVMLKMGRLIPHNARYSSSKLQMSMRSIYFFASVMFMASNMILLTPRITQAADWQQKGATFYAKSTTDFSSANYRQSVDDLAAIGGTDIGLLYHVYQSNASSSDISSGWNTSTDQSLRDGIQYAHSKGLRVMLVLKSEAHDGTWHADFDPLNRSTWFSAYQSKLLYLAELAQSTGVEQLSVGTEMYKLASSTYNPNNTGYWTNMLNNVRSKYSGKLVYGAQHTGDRSELLELGFASQLDYLGISAYFPLTASGNTPEEALRNSWLTYQPRIDQARQMYGKKIVFTEAGYRSVVNAHIDPYSFWRTGAVDLQEQARDFEALFSYWSPKDYYAGTYLWGWETDPNSGGENDTSFSPQNKPAEQTICKWYRNNGTAGCGTTSPGGSVGSGGGTTQPVTSAGYAFTNYIAPTGLVGQQQSTRVSVSSTIAQSATIQVEIFNDKWQSVARKAFPGTSLSSTPTELTIDWTPSQAGTYDVKIGVYSNDWSRTYVYQSLSGSTVISDQSIPSSGGSGGQGSGSGSGTGNPDGGTGEATASVQKISIWWPSATNLRGVQPFRATLDNVNLEAYTMYWQVDNGEQHQMINAYSPAPHKEDSVAVWAWADGAHQLKFIAKDQNGKTIGEATQAITVSR